MSEIFDTLRRAVDNVPGGRKVIAVRLDRNDEVLRKELSGAASHKLGAHDALSIARLCVEMGAAHAYDYAALVARECGGRFVVAEEEGGDNGNPVQRISSLVRETGDVTSVVIEAMSDGVVSDNELAVIEREISEAEEALRKLRRAAQAVNAAGKPRSERGMVTLPVREMRNEVPA